MSGTAVQFYGIDDVVEAYMNKRTPAFAIWCGKQLQFRYDGSTDDDNETDAEPGEPTMTEGEQLLRQYLTSLWPLTTATYTLKTYDDLAPGQKIRPSTEYDTAFNFKICAPSSREAYAPGAVGFPQTNPLLAELKKMNERMDRLEQERAMDDDELEDEPENLQQVVIGLLNEPAKLQQVVEPIKELVSIGRMLLGMPEMNTPAAMNGVKKIGQVNEQPDPALVMRLGQAINTLEQHDEKIVEHLEKLAQVAVTDAVKFKGLLAMLDLL